MLAGLLVRLSCDGTAADDPSVTAAVGVGLGLGDVVAITGDGASVVGVGSTGTALVGESTGTDEICELCETCETCPPPEPDT